MGNEQRGVQATQCLQFNGLLQLFLPLILYLFHGTEPAFEFTSAYKSLSRASNAAVYLPSSAVAQSLKGISLFHLSDTC